MDNEDLEILVYLNEERAEATLDELRSQFSVTQVASSQVAVIRIMAEQLGQVASVDGVLGVFDQEFPQYLLTGLNFTESLFVKAWSIRQEEEPKSRSGDGMDWDAEGFDPPGISDEDWT